MKLIKEELGFLTWFQSGASKLDDSADKVHFITTENHLDVFLFYEHLAIYKSISINHNEDFELSVPVTMMTGFLKTLAAGTELNLTGKGISFNGAKYKFDEYPTNVDIFYKRLRELEGADPSQFSTINLPQPWIISNLTGFIGKDTGGFIFADGYYATSDEVSIGAIKGDNFVGPHELRFPDSMARIFPLMNPDMLPGGGINLPVSLYKDGTVFLKVNDLTMWFPEMRLIMKSVKEKKFMAIYNHKLNITIDLKLFSSALARMSLFCQDNPSQAITLKVVDGQTLEMISSYHHKSREKVQAIITDTSLFNVPWLMSVRDLQRVVNSLTKDVTEIKLGIKLKNGISTGIIRAASGDETQLYYIRGLDLIEGEELDDESHSGKS